MNLARNSLVRLRIGRGIEAKAYVKAAFSWLEGEGGKHKNGINIWPDKCSILDSCHNIIKCSHGAVI